MSLLTPRHSRITGVLLAGKLTSLYSSGNVSHEQDNPHAHGNRNYDRVVSHGELAKSDPGQFLEIPLSVV